MYNIYFVKSIFMPKISAIDCNVSKPTLKAPFSIRDIAWYLFFRPILPVTFRPAPGVELCACRSLFAQNLSRFEYFVNKKNNSTFVLHDRNQTSYTIWSLKYLN